MAEQEKPFVINDRRKFRMDGEPTEPRPVVTETETPSAEAKTPETAAHGGGPVAVERTARDEPAGSGPVVLNSAHTITPVPEPAETASVDAEDAGYEGDETAGGETEGKLPAPPTPEEIEQVRHAYEATAERLDTMMRSQNLGAEHLPPMDFTQVVQSIYMSAMMQLGAGTQQGQQPRVDLMGAKQSIDMLRVIEEKSGSNLSEQEVRLIQAALFELCMGFLEITQLLARQAAAKQTAAPGGMPGSPTGAGGFGTSGFTGGGPRIVK